MLLTTSLLKEQLSEYNQPLHKISRMIKNRELIPITRGLYETEKNTPGYLIAPAIYAPSYLTGDYVLSMCGLIPEAVYTYTSATCLKGKSKEYQNQFGNFSYADIPAKVFPLAVQLKKEKDLYYYIAMPEKALCDKLYWLTQVNNYSQLETLLFDDLRIDETELFNLNIDLIRELCPYYKAKNLKLLSNYLLKKGRRLS